MHRAYLAAMGADASRSVYGTDGQRSSGDLLVVATAGSGFTWGVTALQVA